MAETRVFRQPVRFNESVVFSVSPSPVSFADNAILNFGTGLDQALVSKSTTTNANTAVTSVILGTPVVPALAADTLIVANKTADGDVVLATQTGGNTQAAIWVDASAGETRIYGAGVLNLIATGSTTPVLASKGFRVGLTGAGFFGLGTAESVTIATGVATVTRPLVNLIGEGATTDTLDSIVYTGQAAGDLLLIICSGAYTITFDNSSTLILGAGTRAMAAGSSMLLVATSATVWREVSFLTAAS